jgi:adenosylcobinamide-phosphate synthase
MTTLSLNIAVLTLALLTDAAVGYQERLHKAIGHPVVWIGLLIGLLDRKLNRPEWSKSVRRALGVIALALVVAAAAGPAWVLSAWLRQFPGGWIVEALLASSLLAQRSLYDFVAAVGRGLENEGLVGGRRAVAHIVGRNPQKLDEAGVSRAAIESLAENFSDGVVAPSIWLAIGGLPGIVAYKAINTADSMIGHITEEHAEFGWAAARLDDLVNLPASRLAGFWIALATAFQDCRRARLAIRTMRRDAPFHRSPNAGWPEAAMAAALGLRLGGPRIYGEVQAEDHWMGRGRSSATAADIWRALTLYRGACAAQIAVTALAAVLLALR